MKLQQEANKYIYKVQRNSGVQFQGSGRMFLLDSSKDICFFLDAVKPAAEFKKISQLKCIKRQKELNGFCIYAVLRVNLHWKNEILCSALCNWPPGLACQETRTLSLHAARHRCCGMKSNSIPTMSTRSSFKGFCQFVSGSFGVFRRGHK